jgi:hypothetical protein
MQVFQQLVEQARARCAGRSWPGYAALLALFAWFSVGPMCDGTVWSPVSWMTIAIHEAGHFTTMFWAPAWLSVAAGSLFQWGAPLLCGWLLWRQGEPFSIPVGLVWLGLSLGLSVPYIADASTQALPLISVGNYHPDTHDWNYLLGGLGLLGYDGFLAGLCRLVSVFAVFAGLAVGGWLVVEMARLRSAYNQR